MQLYKYIGVCWAVIFLQSFSVLAGVIQFDFSPPLLKRIDEQNQAKRTNLTVAACQTAPVIDGAGADPAWPKSAQISQLARGGNNPTTVRLCHDISNLYIQVVCKEQPGRVPKVKEDTRDGKVWDDDCVEIRIQPLALNAQQYHFVVNRAGVVYDAAGIDVFYNPVWQAAVKSTEDQWVLEVAIPAAAVGLKAWTREIGFNIGRNIPGVKNQSWNTSWSDTSRSRLVLEGAPEAQAVGGGPGLNNSPFVAVSGKSLALQLDRTTLRPGERWLEGELLITPQKGKLAGTRLEASFSALARAEALDKVSLVPTGSTARIMIDMRAPKLAEGELALELYEGKERTGAVKVLLRTESGVPLAAGKNINVILDVPEGVAGLKNWPVTFGVPFGAGELWDAKGLRLKNKAGKEIPAQKEVTALWGREGSIKWVRFDALVTPEDGCIVEAAEPGAGAQPKPALSVQEDGGGITIDTGVSKYVLGKGLSPIKEVWLSGKKIASSTGTRGLYVVDQSNRLASASAKDESVTIEASGPVAACVRFEGFYKTVSGETLARHITRVQCFAGQAAAKVTHTLVLTEDSNKVWFKEIGWEFGVAAGGGAEAIFGISPTDHGKTHKVALGKGVNSAFMLQDQHYVFAHGSNHFLVGKSGEKDIKELEGEECGDWATLSGKEGGLQLVCRDAARQHPKEFGVFADKIVLKLFSNRSGEELDFRMPALAKRWDLENWMKKAAYDKEQKQEGYVKKVMQYRSNAIGWSRTHQLLINPVAPEKVAETAAKASLLHRHPMFALTDPWWIYATRAMGPLYPKDEKRFPEVEKAQEAAFQWWLNTDRQWGENGFVDYFAGPHIRYSGIYGLPARYVYCTYTLRANIWRIYARAGNRTVREFCEGTTMAYMDNIHMHWNPPAGSGLVRGLYRAAAHFGFPIYWGERVNYEISSSTDFSNYMWLYYLTGERRGKDIIQQYAQGIKQAWTPGEAKGTSRILMLMRLLVQCYAFNWDPELRTLAEATTDLFEDREGELLVSKDRPNNSSSYKTQVDIRALIAAWEILGNPRYRDIALKVSEFWWRANLGTAGFGYNIPMAVVGNFLYSQTGESCYAQAMAVSVRHLVAIYNPQTSVFPDRTIQGAHSTSFIFELDTALDVLARSGADKKTVSSWAGFGDADGHVSIVIQKPAQSIVDLYFKTPSAIVNCFGNTTGVRVRPLNPTSTWGQDLTSVHETSSGTGVVRVPKDAPAGEYEVIFQEHGTTYVFVNAKIPMVIYAPGAWMPMPPQNPVARYYFNLPKESKDAQILFSNPTRLYDPKGVPFGKAGTVKGWVDLPVDKPGLWAFELEPAEKNIVRVRNVPPFFAVGDPALYFTPEIKWEREALPEREKAPTPETVYVPGAINTEGNRAVYLTGTRCLEILPGPDHPAGDGGQFLPFKQGTIEFFMKPTWDSLELNEGSKRFCMGRPKETKGSYYYTLDYKLDEKQMFAMLAELVVKEGRARGVRTFRNQTLFERGKWVHVAWTWGKRSAVYIDGKLGAQRSGVMKGPPFSPMSLLFIGSKETPKYKQGNLDAMVDELRISDIERYAEDFIPPDRTAEFVPDKNTRLLMHFNGNLDVQSFGSKEPAPVKLMP